MCAGYLDRPAETAAAFTAGWFRTGDIGAVDHDGYVRILGRSKELIISGGYNVHPAEVEAVLGAHPAVAEVAVTGSPSDEWGEVVTAWVVPSTGAVDVDSLLAFAAERLAPYKRPRLVRQVPSLPRTAMGRWARRAAMTVHPLLAPRPCASCSALTSGRRSPSSWSRPSVGSGTT